ncbi:hypothetical protein MKW98_017592 [Papaver atlanticum]|uniref:Uncharacterized protein n=1 Tax=Papaver atlanticum TaxID=357466 RepID=A0AAD4XW52_9MAGN|nr:hypothetical protein MKW98_017592 [Papaver atlanticum]
MKKMLEINGIVQDAKNNFIVPEVVKDYAKLGSIRDSSGCGTRMIVIHFGIKELCGYLLCVSDWKYKTRSVDTFDVQEVIKKYGSEEWGEYLIREAHLSLRILKMKLLYNFSFRGGFSLQIHHLAFCSPQPKLHDPALHRVLHKVFTLLLPEFRKLGGKSYSRTSQTLLLTPQRSIIHGLLEESIHFINLG